VSEAVPVLPTAELPAGGRAVVSAFGTSIALFNIDGEMFAVAAVCPHHGGPLQHGRISGTRLPGAPYEHRYGRENRVLTCPWHGWEFDLETGCALFDERMRVRTFDVFAERGQILLRRRAAERRSAA
jgi:3-phenylpropionate/trans-cinnamate dioxygenase ferredoxin subunit